MLAESWEFPDPDTTIFHIKKGLHWAPNPSEAGRLMNGREFTGDDVFFNFKRYITERGSVCWVIEPTVTVAMTVTQLDKWTVVLKSPVYLGGYPRLVTGNRVWQMPPEVIQKYGNVLDWRNSVGTGPFMLTDFVSNASATLIRNPNYWDKDPLGPGKGNQLPYVDTVKMLIVTDPSTRLAAIRTARADWISGVLLDDAESLKKTTPKLQVKRFLPGAPYAIGMRQDNPKLPFHDVRVRQALMLATDFQSIKNDLYRGEAEILVWPIGPLKELKNIYVPMEELPQSVQDLFKYNPQKAKQLLTEAGYPNGFKSKIIVSSTPTSDVDFVSVIKAMWAKVGVDLEIQPREFGVYTSQGRNYDEMKLANITGASGIERMFQLRDTTVSNTSWINDPKVEEAFAEFVKDRLVVTNRPKAEQLFRGLIPYVLEQAYVIPKPTPYTYTFWWPWIKNYRGELNVVSQSVGVSWIPWAWIDQDLKEQMTGRR